jgi:predicted DNA-binding transcriptional regulator AlpA
MKDMDKLPHWPRGLSRTLAASYVGVSPTTFDKMIRDGLMPRPKRVYGRVIWDKLALDDAFDVLDGGHRRDEAGQVVYDFSNEEDCSTLGRTQETYPILSEEEAQKWFEGYQAEKRSDLLARPMGRRERNALVALSQRAGEVVRLDRIVKGCSAATLEKLEWREFVERLASATDRTRIPKYIITRAGIEAASQIDPDEQT